MMFETTYVRSYEATHIRVSNFQKWSTSLMLIDRHGMADKGEWAVERAGIGSAVSKIKYRVYTGYLAVGTGLAVILGERGRERGLVM